MLGDFFVRTDFVTMHSKMARFERYMGIDYSGADTADSSCKGLRVYMAEGSGEPRHVHPPLSPAGTGRAVASRNGSATNCRRDAGDRWHRPRILVPVGQL
jgi:hypothetical protein